MAFQCCSIINQVGQQRQEGLNVLMASTQHNHLDGVFNISFIVREQLSILDCLYSVASLGIRICENPGDCFPVFDLSSQSEL